MPYDETPTEEMDQPLSVPYLVFVIVAGFGIVGMIATAGAMCRCLWRLG